MTVVHAEATFDGASRESEATSPAAIAPDLATCEACLAEVFDPSSRRHGYAFTCCSACGPRLTIMTSTPLERARTTMAGFAMCDACRADYETLGDRRFHSATIACGVCGPQLTDTIDAIAGAIRGGSIVAIKGLGGYHLVCDATNVAAVEELRRRKQREAKPFAVMVEDAAAACELADFDASACELLTSAARPIVLAPRRESRLAAGVAPGVADIGVMLPYTPLHHLLVRALPGLPLVMTGANVTGEPIACGDDDVVERLGPLADRVVSHDRPIHTRCDDSVARVVDGVPLLLRRSRGYAPAPLQLPFRLSTPTLALGGQRNAVFAYGAGDQVVASPHLGDLDDLGAYEAFVAAIDQFARLHRVAPAQVVCDLHPDYATTRIAEQMGLPMLAVQHHHAHFASVFADAGLHGPALGVILDGGGHGNDGTVWGGEILVGDPSNVWRAAHLQEVAQPGGERVHVEAWRMAVAYLAASGEAFADVHPEAERVGLTLSRAPRTTSAARLFDAVAVIAGVVMSSAFEGQAAMQLETLARGAAPETPYPFELAGDRLVVAPMIRAIARDVRMQVGAARIARRFHTTIVELIAYACAQLARGEGLRDVVLSGDLFQNAILASELPARLRSLGLVPHVHRHVPPNDGGLSFGQLAVAAAREV